MPVFVGDFVKGLSVIKDLIGILEDASSARADYQELVAELRGLERGLTAVKELNINEDQQLRFLAVTQAAARCHQCINSFLAKVAKFQDLGKSVSPENSKRKFGEFTPIGTNLRKIRWALSKDDVTKFREEVQLHVSSIQMLLVTLQMSELSTRDGKLDSQNKIHQASIITLSDKLDQNIAMLQKQFELLKSVQTSLMGTLNTRQELECENCHMTYRRIEEIEDRPKKRIRSRRTPVSREVSPQQLPTQPEDECDEISKFRRVHLITNKDNQQTRHVPTPYSPAITSSPGDAATPGQAISTRNLPDGSTPTLNSNPGRVFPQDLPWVDYCHWRTSRGSGGAEYTTFTPVYPGCDLPPPGRYSNVPTTTGEAAEPYSTLSFIHSPRMSDRFLDWLFEGV